MENGVIHTFKNSQKLEIKYSPILNKFYKQCWSIEGKDIVNVTEDRKVDKEITIPNRPNNPLTVEEKIRSCDYWNYREKDILLETISIDYNNTPGWLYTSKADCLIYAFVNKFDNKLWIYKFPLQQLRKWFIIEKDKYKNFKTAKNNGYNTISVVVPIKDIMDFLKSDAKLEHFATHYEFSY